MEMVWTDLDIVSIYTQYKPAVAFVVGTIATAGVYVGGLMLLPRWRGYMIRKARREHVKVILIDKFVDDVEEAILSGEISREEAIETYRDLKKCFPIPDLYPSSERLKEDIQRRMSSGMHEPVILTPVKKPKNMLDRA